MELANREKKLMIMVFIAFYLRYAVLMQSELIRGWFSPGTISALFK